MPLTSEETKKIRKEIDNCKKPLIFFDDDPDGMSSFLLLYRYIREGKGIPIKTTPHIKEMFVRKVDEFEPDKVFILDTAKVDDEFVDGVHVPIIWVDHHEVQNVHGVKYFNPLKNGDVPTCTTEMMYQVINDEDELWLAGTGIVSDWQFTDTLNKVSKKYPDLLPADVKKPEDALFNTKLGKLARIFSFILMGDTKKAMTCVKILTRINDPYEILDVKTPQAKFLHKRFMDVNSEYELLLKDALKTKSDDGFLIYTYKEARYSLTKDLSNEVLYRNQDKVIIIAREKNGDMKMSLRSAKCEIHEALQKALVGVEGFGGGHAHACGANVRKEDWERFLEAFKEEISNQ